MVSISEWLVTGLLRVIRRRSKPLEHVLVRVVDLNAAGRISDAQLQTLAVAIEAAEAEDATTAEPPVTEAEV